MKKKKLRLAILLSLTIALSSYLAYDHEYIEGYNINDQIENPYGSYKHGRIYIGNSKYIESIKECVKPGDVLIVEGYYTDEGCLDPDYRILSSHLIDNKDDRNDILNVLYWYNYITHGELDRSLESMRVEWAVHNFLYKLGISRDRTGDVDLNNGDEETYSNPIIKRLVK